MMKWISLPMMVGIFFLGGSFIPQTAEARMVYTRGLRSKSPHTPNRFLYTHPQYQARKAPLAKACKPNGQARCFAPKKPNPFRTNRYLNPLRIPKVHPYVRKIFKPYTKRNF